MTKGLIVPESGADAPDPMPVAHAMDELRDAVCALEIMQRALTAELRRLQADHGASRDTVLTVLRVNGSLLTEAVTSTRSQAEILWLAMRRFIGSVN